MADRINLNRLRSINFAPDKNVAKTTAALTLLLSTVACSSGGQNSSYLECCIVPMLLYVGVAMGLVGIGSLINRGGRGGGGSDGYHPTQ